MFDCSPLLGPVNRDPDPRLFMAFANPGDWILAEEWTYPLALAGAHPWGIQFAPVAVDGEGLCAVDLHRVLAEWNEVERGGKRYLFIFA